MKRLIVCALAALFLAPADSQAFLFGRGLFFRSRSRSQVNVVVAGDGVAAVQLDSQRGFFRERQSLTVVTQPSFGQQNYFQQQGLARGYSAGRARPVVLLDQLNTYTTYPVVRSANLRLDVGYAVAPAPAVLLRSSSPACYGTSSSAFAQPRLFLQGCY